MLLRQDTKDVRGPGAQSSRAQGSGLRGKPGGGRQARGPGQFTTFPRRAYLGLLGLLGLPGVQPTSDMLQKWTRETAVSA